MDLLVPTVVRTPTSHHDIGELPAAAERYVLAGLYGAASTHKAYLGNWYRFTAYCQRQQCASLPATVPTVVSYLAGLADRGQQFATIRLQLAAITKVHYLSGQPFPTDHHLLRALLSGIARLNGRSQRQAPAFTVPDLKQAVRALDITTAAGLRDRALLLLGFAGAFRRSELVALNVEDLELTDHLLIRVRRSKTNQYGQQEDKAVFYAADAAYCPVRAVQEWLAVLGLRTGPLFTSFRRGRYRCHAKPTSQRLSAQTVTVVVRQCLGPTYSAHSLRVSFVTVAMAAGQSHRAIRSQTKHQSDAMVEKYIRFDDVAHHNAAQHLGL